MLLVPGIFSLGAASTEVRILHCCAVVFSSRNGVCHHVHVL